MLSSNSSSCCNPNHNPNYTLFSENDITSFSSSQSQQQQQDPNYNNFFFSFPNSPQMHFDQYDDDYLHFLDNFSVADWSDKITPSSSIGGGNPNSTAAAARPAARGRNLKKDRHSKINTAGGPRDRRVRLSLDIARRFFDLQDLLGYDKASRTVDWLLRNSSSAIRALARRGRDGVVEHSSLGLTESCTSEDCGEAVSSSATAATAAAAAAAEAGGKNKSGRKGKRGGGVQQKRATIGRESRRKARERARERTSQKRRLVRERERGGTASAAAGTTTHNFPIYDDEQATADEVLFCQFNLHAITNTHEFLQQGEQIADIEFNGKPWEAYNSFNLSG